MGLLEKSNTNLNERKKPYLDRIHTHQKVKKLYIVNEIMGFVEWILWTMLFVVLLAELNGIKSEFGVQDITYIYAYMLQSYTGTIIIGVLAVVLCGYKFVRKSMRKKLETLEDEVYAEITLADGVTDIIGSEDFADLGDGSAGEEAEGDTAPKPEPPPKLFALFKVLSIVKSFVTLAMIGILLYSVWGYLPFAKLGSAGNNPGGDEILVELDAPSGIKYDPETHTLSWNSVDGAVSYQVEHNGRVYDVFGASTTVLISESENIFKVKAIASTETLKHRDSDWSWPLAYQLNTASLTLYDRINIKLGAVAKEKQYKLIEVIGISYLNPNPEERENIVFDTLCEKNKEIKFVSFTFTCAGATTAAEIMANLDSAILYNTSSSKTVTYNSVQVYLDSLAYDETYDGCMKELLDLGYSITPVKSVVLKGSEYGIRFRYNFVATYAATKGNDVVCFTVYHRVITDSISSDDKNNYETSLISRDYSSVREVDYVFHERGGSGDYMYELIKLYAQNR